MAWLWLNKRKNGIINFLMAIAVGLWTHVRDATYRNNRTAENFSHAFLTINTYRETAKNAHMFANGSCIRRAIAKLKVMRTMNDILCFLACAIFIAVWVEYARTNIAQIPFGCLIWFHILRKFVFFQSHAHHRKSVEKTKIERPYEYTGTVGNQKQTNGIHFYRSVSFYHVFRRGLLSFVRWCSICIVNLRTTRHELRENWYGTKTVLCDFWL